MLHKVELLLRILHTVELLSILHTVELITMLYRVELLLRILHTVELLRMLHTVELLRMLHTVELLRILHTVELLRMLHTVELLRMLHTVYHSNALKLSCIARHLRFPPTFVSHLHGPASNRESAPYLLTPTRAYRTITENFQNSKTLIIDAVSTKV